MLEGKTLKEFQEALKKLDSVTGVQTIRQKDPFTLTCNFDKGTLESWRVDPEEKKMDLNKVLNKGMSLKKFRSSLRKIDQNNDLDIFYVMCLRDYKKVDSYYYDTNWFAIDPGVPYYLNEKGQPEFLIIKRRVNKENLQIILETKLAFFADETLYPVLPSATQILGTLLDCSAAFKQQDEHQLGNALMIAEKLSGVKNLRILYRERTEDVCPIYSAFGASYQRIEQAEFFDSVLDCLKDFTIFQIDKWKIRTEDSEIVLKLLSMNVDDMQICEKKYTHPEEPVIQNSCGNKETCYLGNESVEYIIRVHTGDFSGKGLSVQSFLRYEDAEILLKSNTMKHTPRYYKEHGVYQLLSGIGASILEAYQMMHFLKNHKGIIEYEPLLERIYKTLGKKRTQSVQMKVNWMGAFNNNAEKQFLNLVDATFCELPPKQAVMLAKCYKELFDGFFNEVAKSVSLIQLDHESMQAECFSNTAQECDIAVTGKITAV